MVHMFNQYISAKSLLLTIIESLMIALALICGARLRFWDSPSEFEMYIRFPGFFLQSLMVVITFQVCFHYGDLYDWSSIRNRNQQLISLGQSLGAGCLVLGLLYYIFPNLLIGRGVLFISTVFIVGFVILTRLALDIAWKADALKQNVLILGSGELAVEVARELSRRDDLNIRLVGLVQAAGENGHGALSGKPILGTAAKLSSIAKEHRVSRIIVAMEDRRGALPIRELVTLRVQGLLIEDAHSTIAALSGRVWLRTVQPSWFVFSGGFHRSQVTQSLKRTLDLVFGVLGLIVSLPLMLVIAILLRLDTKGPVIFRQTRVGKGGRAFEVLKFRSMCENAEQNGAQWAAENDSRVTRVGRFLRKYRLDELPQFLNIIRGHMSFVGPRPERPVFVKALGDEISYYDERHSVRPGLTGWAQVQYTYGSSLEDARRKLEYDLFYLKNMSILFDCGIILKTIRIVLTGHGGR